MPDCVYQDAPPSGHGHSDSGGIVIAIPLYKGAELIPGLCAALAAVAQEIQALAATILFINDSPQDAPLIEALDLALPALRSSVPSEVLTNARNIGFVQTANRAFSIAIERRQDIILLNSDAVPTPGALAEMAAVARLDPMIGFVSPRSNNASICNSPWPDHFRGRDAQQSLADHQAIAHLLPRYTLVPTAVGFCLYVRRLMLLEFGLFDEIYAGGYNEENDLIRRCNQRGFRAALANHAFVYHLGGASFVHSSVSTYERERVNGAILRERYPEYDIACHRYFMGAGHRAERLLSGLIPTAEGKLRILFCCDLLKASFNGTFELAKRLIEAFAARHGRTFEINVHCDEDAFRFHGLSGIPDVRRCAEYEMRSLPFAIAFRLSQPFTRDDVTNLHALAPITGSLMLDTIALDCQQIDPSDLDMLWRLTAETSDILGYISDFSRDQFKRRFQVQEHVVEFVALCSTDVEEYADGTTSRNEPSSDERAILIVGNHYPHKHVRETLAEIRRAAPERKVRLLGIEADGFDRAEGHVAGLLPQSLVDTLYDNAEVVLFPSHYEGFGLPIMHALARGKPVVARDLPPACEIKARTPLGHNIHLAATTTKMVELALNSCPWKPAQTPPPKPVQRWGDAADDLADAFKKALSRVSYDQCLTHQARILFQPAHASESRSAHVQDRALAAEDLLALLSREGASLGGDLINGLDLCLTHASSRDGSSATISVSTAVPDDGGSFATLTITDDPFGIDFNSLEETIFRWAPHILPGGKLRLDLPAQRLIDPTFPNATHNTVVKAMLANAGFAPLSLVEQDGRMIADAQLLTDWRSILPGPDSDLLFVRFVYRHLLGREPDPQGEATFAGLLAQGSNRETVLLSIYRSAERRAYVNSRIIARHAADSRHRSD